MRRWAEYLGDPFPPQDYWSEAERPHERRYEVSPRSHYTPPYMDGVPTDDDTIYTQLGLLILEDYGPDFTVEDVGEAWLKYLPYAHTAERVALNNLRKGMPAHQVAEIENPYVQYIGADIRSDPWGYAAPGWPEKAAALAYRDAYISHRRNGIYAAMYFSAVISAAFTVDDPMAALHIGLEEIPANCLLAREVRWALNEAGNIRDYREANEAVTARLAGMDRVHAINNACLTIWGLAIGGRDFSKIIGETVAMGYDNDCTAATAGSIAGAVFGSSAIPAHWSKNFNNKVISYLNGHSQFAIDDLVNRFAVQVEKVFAN
jgi:ADP-ribosylglycohydrolase